MCRLLWLGNRDPLSPSLPLQEFAAACKDSPEYQGHGYGISWLEGSAWRHHHSITPIWEDKLPNVPASSMVIAHARSAFRDEGITIENNMPFTADGVVFAFNGELQGVRLKEQGRIGAEKIFNVIRGQYEGDWGEALRKGTRIITSRTRRVRAMNIVLATAEAMWLYSDFDDQPDYFTLQRHQGQQQAIASMSLPSISGWEPVERKQVQEFRI